MRVGIYIASLCSARPALLARCRITELGTDLGEKVRKSQLWYDA